MRVSLHTVDLTKDVKDTDGSTAAYCLGLPGKTLFLSHLLSLKKFRKRGHKEGALRAFYKLEEEGLGKVLEVAGCKGSQCVSNNTCAEHLYNFFNTACMRIYILLTIFI